MCRVCHTLKLSFELNFKTLKKKCWVQVFSAKQAELTVPINSLFSFLHARTCLIASLWVTHTNGPSQMLHTSCFLFSTLFETRVTDHMWGTTQLPVSSPLNVPFMSWQHWASSSASSSLMWSLEKKEKRKKETQQLGSSYALARKVYKFRKRDSSDYGASSFLQTFHLFSFWKISTQNHFELHKVPVSTQHQRILVLIASVQH